MLCTIYKSLKKEGTYLFIERKGDFSRIPDTLISAFGPPQLVMTFNLTPERELAMADSGKVLESLEVQGYYLQLPPPPVNLLDEYKDWRAEQKTKMD